MPQPLRYVLDDPDYAGAFVEFTPRWKRGEIRRFWAEDTPKNEWLALVRSKVTAIHLDSITEPDALTEEALDEVDYVLWEWFKHVCLKVAVDVGNLGEAAGRRLWATTEEPAPDRPKNS